MDVISARTAVGHDKEGKLILFHVDGQTGVRGWEWTLNLSWCQLFITVNIDLFPLSVHATTQTKPEWFIDQEAEKAADMNRFSSEPIFMT